MSWQPAADPACTEDEGAIDLVIESRTRDIGGFAVRRVLPSAKRRTVGPFIFLDEMGPADLPVGRGLDVAPHPHIGLATVTYLFEGKIMHRDSLGSEQAIRPGAVNWMNAGRGIVHSERSPEAERTRPSRLWGIQSWVALPLDAEKSEPAFHHYPAERLPHMERGGAAITLLVGEAFGMGSPVATASPALYADVQMAESARLDLPGDVPERAVYVVRGAVETAGRRFEAGTMAVFREGAAVTVAADGGAARLMLLGGATVDGKRHIWWNFVASSRERIEAAKADWRDGRFPAVPGDDDFVPLPET